MTTRALVVVGNTGYSSTGTLFLGDGTAGGTQSESLAGTLEAISPASTSLADRALLAIGTGLYVTDGSLADTVPVPGAPSGSIGIPVVLGTRALLAVSATSSAGDGIYATDGTAAGTVELAATGTQIPAFVGATASLALFDVYGAGLLATDGTASGTRTLSTAVTAYGLPTLTPAPLTAGGEVLFDAGGSAGDLGLYETDGTAAGTVPLLAGGTTTLLGATDFAQLGGSVLFAATPQGGTAEVWTSDGIGGGTTALLAGTLAQAPTTIGTHAFLALSSGSSLAAYATDGTAAGSVALLSGVTLAAMPNSVTALQTTFAALGGRALFAGQVNGTTQFGLWSSDGTAAGTTLLSGLGDGAIGLSQVTAFGDRLAFTTSDGAGGVLLWSTDGTSAGTVRLLDQPASSLSSNYGFNGGTGSIRILGSVGGLLIYGLITGATTPVAPIGSIWATDGTLAGTRELAANLGVVATGSTLDGRITFEAASGTAIGLYGTDGTSAGTTLAAPLYTSPPAGAFMPRSIEQVLPEVAVTATLTLTPATVTAAAGSLTVLGPGLSVVQSAGRDTVQGGTGQATIYAGSDPQPPRYVGELLFGGSGAITFINGQGVSTVVGGAGAITAYTGQGGGAYFGSPSGGNTLVAQGYATVLAAANGDQVDLNGTGNTVALGSGAETVNATTITGAADTIFGGTGPDVIQGGAQGGNVIVAGSGAETIFASAVTRPVRSGIPGTIFLGSGADVVAAGPEATFIQAGSGTSTVFAGGANGAAAGDVFAFVDGGAGGTELIGGFRVGTDQIALRGYGGSSTMAGIANSQVTGGSTVLTLADNTRITLQGVTNLGASSFV